MDWYRVAACGVIVLIWVVILAVIKAIVAPPLWKR